MIVTLQLNEAEYRELMEPKWIRGRVKGGFQLLAEALQLRARRDRTIILDHELLAKIQTCGTQHGSGGWQAALHRIFDRLLGPKLDRYAPPPGPKQVEMAL